MVFPPLHRDQLTIFSTYTKLKRRKKILSLRSRHSPHQTPAMGGTAIHFQQLCTLRRNRSLSGEREHTQTTTAFDAPSQTKELVAERPASIPPPPPSQPPPPPRACAPSPEYLTSLVWPSLHPACLPPPSPVTTHPQVATLTHSHP